MRFRFPSAQAATPEPHAPVLVDYANNAIEIEISGEMMRHSSFASLRFATAGASLRIGYWADFPDNAWLTIVVDGTYNQTVTLTADAAPHTIDVTLPSGAKTVEIWEGPQYGDEPSVQVGGIVTSIEMLDATMIMRRPTRPARRVVIYGDSISQGYGGQPKDSYFGLLRLASSFGFTSYGSGGRRLSADAEVSPGISATASRLAAMLADGGQKDLIVVIGTNDWGTDQSLATFATQLAALVDAVHASRPDAIVRLVSPLARTDEASPNGNGDELADFRAAMSTVASTRDPWCLYYDASGVITVETDTGDGIHLNGTGNVKMKNYLLGTVLE